MAKKRKKKKRNSKLLYYAIIAIVIIGTLISSVNYCKDIYDKYQEKKELEKELAQLKEKEKELKLDASKLQDSDYVARYAREKYYYSKDGELIIKLMKKRMNRFLFLFLSICYNIFVW